MNFGGIDIAWSRGKTGICIIGERIRFELFKGREVLSFNFPSGLYLIDAPLFIPIKGIRELDRRLRKETGIPVLPANRSLFPYFLPEELLKILQEDGFKEWKGERKEGKYYKESFVPVLRKQVFSIPKFNSVNDYRRKFKKRFGFLPTPPSSHLLDAWLLAKKAQWAYDGEYRIIKEKNGEILI